VEITTPPPRLHANPIGDRHDLLGAKRTSWCCFPVSHTVREDYLATPVCVGGGELTPHHSTQLGTVLANNELQQFGAVWGHRGPGGNGFHPQLLFVVGAVCRRP